MNDSGKISANFQDSESENFRGVNNNKEIRKTPDTFARGAWNGHLTDPSERIVLLTSLRQNSAGWSCCFSPYGDVKTSKRCATPLKLATRCQVLTRQALYIVAFTCLFGEVRRKRHFLPRASPLLPCHVAEKLTAARESPSFSAQWPSHFRFIEERHASLPRRHEPPVCERKLALPFHVWL
ncbi:hypothetical protein MTO96_049755 [Rhipicephalus appendiculatus]